jgi:hypothetical protein
VCRARPSKLPKDLASTSRWNAPASSPPGQGFRASTAGAKRALVSAPADNADATIVYGVNQTR